MQRQWSATAPARRRAAGRSAIACALLLLVVGCGADPAFESAERANTPAAWEEYLRQHPDGSNAREARERLAARLDDREWFRADEAHTQAAYEAYLRSYAQGIHSHEALLAIANLNLVVPPPKPGAVAEVQLVSPPEPVLRKPSAGAIARASQPLSAVPARPEQPVAGGAAKAAANGGSTPAPVAAPGLAMKLPPPGREPTPKVAAVAAGAAGTSARPGPATAALKVATATPPAGAQRREAPTPAPVEALAMRTGDASGYRVQLGAFFSEGSATAERVWLQLQARYAQLNDRRPLIAAARSADGRSIYRLQVGGLARETAESLCASLGEHHDPCIVIAPLKGPAP